ncbi:MAG: hypothetical protein M1837_004966 [Sclerophora amabilis]|nr:MAG: hypothetical protein M1837_004966 [Sclerophora amabilis]
MSDGGGSAKRHAACDECRSRKLKCSGDPLGCSRCIRDNIVCSYSERKRMGRPRKRRRSRQSSFEDSEPGPASETELAASYASQRPSSLETAFPVEDPMTYGFTREGVNSQDSLTGHFKGDASFIADLRFDLSTEDYDGGGDNIQAWPSAVNNSAFQTFMLLGTLLFVIADGYGKMLDFVDLETAQSEAMGQKRKLRMGEVSTHLHTGKPDCPAGFDVELDPAEWRRIARSVVRTDISRSGVEGSKGLMDLADYLEQRQQLRHQQQDVQRQCLNSSDQRPGPDADPFCLRVIQNVRMRVNGLRLDD